MSNSVTQPADVATEILNGDGLNPAAAAKLMPPSRKARPVSPQTIIRWITVGVTTKDGRQVRLEGRRIGTTYFTTAAALNRFIARQCSDVDASNSRDENAPQKKRQRATEQAGKELEKLGV